MGNLCCEKFFNKNTTMLNESLIKTYEIDDFDINIKYNVYILECE